MRLEGVHHVTSITGDAPGNVDFCTRVLGLRLVAKSVNQDQPDVYHLFYADEDAQPGSELTFFEFPGAAPGQAGDGMVHTIQWRVAAPAALDFWAARIGDESLATQRTERGLRFADPEGLGHELVVASPDAPLAAEAPDIPAEHALQGLHGVRAYASHPQRSAPLLERVLGATSTGEPNGYELRGEQRGGTIAYDPPPPALRPRPGAGTVHHVAWGTSAAEHPRWQERLEEAGIPTSGIIDRHYFHSIYFREPSGVLFEIADDEPGFTVDLPFDRLGTEIILPPFLEDRREELTARLTPLPDPRAGRR